ncbi:MAG: DUF29 domain-containing protein [Actinomycetota bacterium]
MTSEVGVNRQSLYEVDYLRWIEVTVEKLRSQDYSEIDWEWVIEELKEMGRSEGRSLKSHLVILVMHLLKWQFQPEMRSGNWKGSIVEHRRQIRDALKESPSLKLYLEEVFAECYSDAVEQVSAETELPGEIFPPACPYPLVEVLAANFLPDAQGETLHYLAEEVLSFLGENRLALAFAAVRMLIYQDIVVVDCRSEALNHEAQKRHSIKIEGFSAEASSLLEIPNLQQLAKEVDFTQQRILVIWFPEGVAATNPIDATQPLNLVMLSIILSKIKAELAQFKS